MVVDVLNKFVRKMIIPEFPWIKDFIWHKSYSRDNDKNYWTLEVIQDPEFNVTDSEMNELELEVLREVNTIFKMLNLPKTEEFFTALVR